MTATINGEVVRAFALELFKGLGIIALHPAGSVDVHRLVDGLNLVLVFQTVGHHIKLQHPDRADDQVTVTLRHKHLCGAFLGKLLQALLQLLGFHRVFQANAAE